MHSARSAVTTAYGSSSSPARGAASAPERTREPRDDAEHGRPHPSDDRAALHGAVGRRHLDDPATPSTRDRSRQRCRHRGRICLALAADIRIAADDAYFRAAGINNGLTAAELGLSYLLPRSVGQSRAAEIMLTDSDIDATEADRIGLVSRVVPNARLLPECFELADRINGWGRAGVELTKRQLWNSLDASSLQSHMDAEGTAQLFVRITTRNFEESVAARKEAGSRVQGLKTRDGQGELTSELAAISR